MARTETPNGAALAVWLADDARVNRPGAAAAISRDAGVPLTRQWLTLDYSDPLRMEASAGGDMVFSMGEAHWNEGGVQKRGHYARVWQLRAEGWRVVFDETVPTRGRLT